MPPKDILKELIEKELTSKLEVIGFKYSPSQLEFSKKFKRNEITIEQEIHFSLDMRNTTESMHFWTMWSIFLENKETKEKAKAGSADWNIPGWYTPDGERSYGKFDFSDPKKRISVMADLWRKIINAGLPYLEKFSDWEEASKSYKANRGRC